MHAVCMCLRDVVRRRQSSRMDMLKALLRIGYEPLISPIVRAVKADFDDIIDVGCRTRN